LSNEEKERKKKEHLCAYCGSADHYLNKCTLKNKNKPSSSSSYVSNPKPKPTPRKISDQPDVKLPIFEFTLYLSDVSTKTKILLDCGSQFNI